MNWKSISVLGILGVLALSLPILASPDESSPVWAEKVVLAPLDSSTLYAVADAYVDSATPTQNYGSATTLYVGNQTLSIVDRALFRFDLSSLPSNAVIDSANLRVYMNQAPSSPPLSLDIGVYRITASWNETGVVWANQPAVLSIGKVTGVGMTVQYYEWEVTGLAQDWLASPATNFGLELRSQIEGTVGWRGFASREATAASRPQLVIQFHLPTCNDPQEPNDTFGQAFLISAGVEYLGCIPTPSDLDYFRFDVPPNTAIRVELFSLPANYDLYLYNPAQALLDSSTNGGTTSEMVEYTTGPAGGQFYAKVQSGGEWDLYNPYALKLTLTAVPVWPDLVINDVWRADGQVCYEIENIGLATALQGHATSLRIDGLVAATDTIGVDLAPGATLQRCFVHQWQCTLPQDTLTVCADYADDVAESDESNNCIEEIWPCDTSPPIIITGPTVSNITSAGATVSWTTDEASNSTVLYGRKAELFEGEASNTSMTQTHAIVLTGLQPSTTYRYIVRSADAAGNTVSSREAFFTTGPTSSPPPSILGVTLTRMPGKPIYYTIAATVPLSLNVERLEFYMDGELLGKAYTPKPGALPGLYEFPLIPATLNIPREQFFANHEIEVVAVGFGGLTGRFPVQFTPTYECADIHVEMDYPYPDHTLYFDDGALPPGTTVPIEVYAWALYESECNHIPWQDRIACDIEAHSIERIDFAIQGAQICTFTGHNWPWEVYTCNWDASGLGAGIYGIRVDVIANEACKQTLFRDVTVAQGESELDVTREVTRHGNYFEVALTVRNRGHASYDVDRVEDYVAGFQPISKSADLGGGRRYEVGSDCATTAESCEVTLDVFDGGLAAIRLEGGDSLALSYLVVPVLLPDPRPEDQAIGDEPVRVVGRWEAENPTFDRPCVTVSDGALLANAVISATAESDYLIVTRPERLFSLHNAADVNALLVDMAELAHSKNGILGYLVGGFNGISSIADDTILEWGAGLRGSDGEPENWLSNGYLLLVGETDIVPSFSILDVDIWQATDGWSSPVLPVRLVDNAYADTDDRLSPELIVGRIIGDDIASLRLPLEIARLDAFDCSRALTVSGLDANTVKLDSFVTNANDIAEAFTERFTEVAVEHWSEYATVTDALDSFVIAVQARDVIVYSDHGGRRSWSKVLDTGDFPLDFLGAHPIVAAFACSTGYYDGINSIADKFLDSEAGGYIGSTELASRPVGLEAGSMFAERWPAAGVSAGMALRDTKHELLRGDETDFERLWVMEYNLYGDPKYGVWPIPEMTVAESSALSAILSPTSLDVIVPDYQVTASASGELDTARIPGGLMLLESGLPMVPIYVVTQPYPKGTRVQDVTLVTRFGLVTATGLNLPLVGDDPASAAAIGSSKSVVSGAGWYPEKDFAWEVEEKADGTTTLVIRMYPFYYDAATTDVQFYKNYSFDIRVITPSVEIESVTTDKRMYSQGESVLVGMVISGTDNTEDVIVEAVIRHYGSDALVDGLLLRSLVEMQGLATFSTQWDSVDPGFYNAEVTLRNTAGDVLDRATAQFIVGITAGDITAFTVTPTLFDIGEQVALSLTFANTGTVPLTGTTVVQIQTETGEMVQEFSHDYGNLAPGDAVVFADAWDTTGVVRGNYRAVAYVLYESTATEPRAVNVWTRRLLYLPLILKGSQ